MRPKHPPSTLSSSTRLIRFFLPNFQPLMLNLISLPLAILEAQGGKATYTETKLDVSHKATCAICSDPIPTEIASHWWKFITKNTQKLIQMPIVQLFLYLHSISKLGAVFCTAETHTVTKPDVAWEITRFTSIKLLQQPSDHQGELLLMTKELIGGHGRTRWGLCQKHLQ